MSLRFLLKNTDDHLCLYNDQLHLVSKLQIPLQYNRAFRYGDGLFESIRVINGRPQLLSKHWDRLYKGMQFLQIDIPPDWSIDFWQHQISRLTLDRGQWRIRLSIFREAEGLYTPQTNGCNFLLERSPLSTERYEPNEEGLQIGVCQSVLLSPQALYNHKTINSLPYVLAGMERRKNKWDDGLLLNEIGRIVEGCSSNLFIYTGGQLLTPPLSDGCVAGVMRQHILEIAQQLELPLMEISMPLEAVEKADEIFLSNAIQGIKWVKQLNNCTFGQIMYSKLLEQINLRIE